MLYWLGIVAAKHNLHNLWAAYGVFIMIHNLRWLMQTTGAKHEAFVTETSR